MLIYDEGLTSPSKYAIQSGHLGNPVEFMEMNMHLPQNELAETELKMLAATPYQIVSPAGNAPIIGIYQDSMLGTFQFTREEIKFTPLQAMNLLMRYNKTDVSAFADKKEITNFDLLSQIMPPITLKYKNKFYEENEIPNNKIVIENGVYKSGHIEKSVLAGSTKGIIHRIYNDFGYYSAADFIDNLQNIITEYMKTHSFSVGISDLISDKATTEKILNEILAKKMEVKKIMDKVHLGVFENDTTSKNIDAFESQVNGVLNKATEEAGKIGRKSLHKSNRFVKIINSGSKGNHLNISQMISCLGQQNVDGKRIPYGFDSRTLPHFLKFDDSPNARGFIENSYISGLTAPELFFHAMGGRIGLIDTAVKTSQTGYIQRRLIKGLEDLRVDYDMTVRNSKGKIVQFQYGDDGFDSTKVEVQNLPFVSMSIEDVYMHYDILGTNKYDKDLLLVYSKSTIERMNKQKDETKAMCKKYIDKMLTAWNTIVSAVFGNKNESKIYLPVAFQHTINNIQGNLGLSSNTMVDITPLEAFQLIEEYYSKLTALNFSKPTYLFEIMYYFYLTPRELLTVKRFHRKALVVLLETVLLKYKQAVVHPGEMVGVIAGQSIGEPTTQLTLNTFHNAGVASKSNVTRGVPRIEEILRLAKSPKNSSLTVYLKPLDETMQEKATKYANMMEHTKLVDVVNSIQICFDPDDQHTRIEEDKELLEQFYEFERIAKKCNGDTAEFSLIQDNKSKWVVRMEMDAETLLDKNITMDDIHFAIKNSTLGSDVECVYSDYNMSKLVFRIRMNIPAIKKKNFPEPLDQTDNIFLLKNFQDNLLNNIVLRGINGIDKVHPRKMKNMLTKQDGKYVQQDIWVLDTTGTNLLDTLGQDYIDYTRTYSNDIKEMYDVLGLEAARQTIFNEMVEVMEFSDVYINYHHMSILCDRMTTNKDMVSIFRGGILADNIGPIAKSTFEVHTEVLLDAARHGEFDHMRGVSANVMCGQNGYFGTNAFNVVLDLKEMAELESQEVNTKTRNEEISDMFGKMEKDSDICPTNRIQIKNNIENIKRKDVAICDDDYNMGF